MIKLIFAILILFSITTVCADINNFSLVSEGIYRGGNIGGYKNYKMLSDLGVKSIVNLEYMFRDSPKYCKEFHFNCQKFGILLTIPHSDYYFNYVTLKRAFNAVLVEREKGNTVYLHCFRGRDRSGALAAALTIRELACAGEHDSKEIKDIVIKDLLSFGFKPKTYPYLYSNIVGWTQNVPDWICQ